MDRVCLVLPILYGQTEAACAVMRELATGRRADHERSAQRLGITREDWYLAQTPWRDQLVVHLEGRDCPAALRRRARSADEFDRWFTSRLAEVTGADLGQVQDEDLPQLLVHYEAERPISSVK